MVHCGHNIYWNFSQALSMCWGFQDILAVIKPKHVIWLPTLPLMLLHILYVWLAIIFGKVRRLFGKTATNCRGLPWNDFLSALLSVNSVSLQRSHFLNVKKKSEFNVRKGGEALENSSFPILGMFSSFVLREVWNEKEKKHGAFPELRITVSFISRSQCANRDESLPSSPSSSGDAALSTSFSFYFFCSLFFERLQCFLHTHTHRHTLEGQTHSLSCSVYIRLIHHRPWRLAARQISKILAYLASPCAFSFSLSLSLCLCISLLHSPSSLIYKYICIFPR